MNMQTIWFRKKIMFWCALAFLLWLLLRKKQYTVSHKAIIYNSKPIDVWEFVADFSNMKKLNPTIVDFTIERESGNYNHWEYTVHYTEFLSHLPFIQNYAEAHYQVGHQSKTSYIIKSEHNTCLYTSLACVKSESSFTFEPNLDSSTRCVENITYECPAVFSVFCEKEVWFQRKAIMENLQKAFTSQ